MKTGKEIEQEYSQQFADMKPEITPMHELIDRAIQEAVDEQDKITRHAVKSKINSLELWASEGDMVIDIDSVHHAIDYTKAI